MYADAAAHPFSPPIMYQAYARDMCAHRAGGAAQKSCGEHEQQRGGGGWKAGSKAAAAATVGADGDSGEKCYSPSTSRKPH